MTPQDTQIARIVARLNRLQRELDDLALNSTGLRAQRLRHAADDIYHAVDHLRDASQERPDAHS